MIHEYKTARSVCGFVEFCAWAGVIFCVIAILISIGTSASVRGGSLALVAVVPIFIGLMLCFFVIVNVQMARASMDGSVAAQITVRDSNKQHQEVLSALRSYGERASSRTSESYASGAPSTGWSDRGPGKPTKDPNRPTPTGVPIAAAAYAETKKLNNTMVIEYRGDEILETPSGSFTRNRKFEDIDDARLYLDRGGSKPAKAQTGLRSASPSTLASNDGRNRATSSTTYQTHHGFRIYPEGMGVRVGDRNFRSLDSAQVYIDELRDLETKMAQNGVGQLPYRNTTIVFTAGAFDVRGRTFTALSRAMNFLDDQLEPVAPPEPSAEEPLQLDPDHSRQQTTQRIASDPHDPAIDDEPDRRSGLDRDVSEDPSKPPTLVADRRPPPGLG